MKNELEKNSKTIDNNLKKTRVKANKQAFIHLIIFLICTIFFMMLILDSYGQQPLDTVKPAVGIDNLLN